MSLNDISIKPTYRTSEDDVINDFLVPALKNAIKYKRAAGFFSSTALVKLSQGIAGLIKNNGKMKLVVSPNLSEKDIEAIKKGYENKEKIIEEKLKESLEEELCETEKDRLNLMISLIEKGILDIKIAILEHDEEIGMYHEKIGIIEDEEGNKIAFTGSYNESLNSYVNNFESLDVYSSLSSEYERVEKKNKDFEKLWNNETESLIVKEFPEAVKEELFAKYYKKEKVMSEEEIIKKEKEKKEQQFPKMPEKYLRGYQEDAIESWEKHGFRGVFDMATGTGKTVTALGAGIKVLEECENNLAIIIICPYTHLVEQWIEDLENFGFSPIVGYGSMKNKRWQSQLSDNVLKFKLGLSKYFCFITTNATFKSDFIQEQLEKIEKKNVLFIADEAHNLGAPQILSKLNDKIKYRLALSATFERYNDEEGTKELFDYFGNNYCIHYSLRQAIDDDKLTEYKYYPIITYLNDEELEEYENLTRAIGKILNKEKNKRKKRISEEAKLLLLKRARLVAGAKEKMHKAVKILEKQKEEKGEITNTLIYCGATTVNDVGYEEDKIEIEEEKQVDYMRKKIKEELKISVAKFTSLEDQEERKAIKEQFIEKEINAVVAIKCLDEGVNIPSIHTAYILASSTNPREYIQRRGRVLRPADGKEYAVIYDFITLPRRLEDAQNLTEEILKGDLGLVQRELIRMQDFAVDSLNYSQSIEITDKIKSVYGELLYKYKEEIE